MKGKTCLVTGASSGLGRAVALQLAREGATVVIVARDARIAQQTCNEIAKESGSKAIEWLDADLSRQSEVHRLAREFTARHRQLHLLVNNAGATFSSRSITEDQVEKTLAINAVTPFLLTELLSDQLKASSPSRVINIASGMVAPIDFNDAARRDRDYKQMAVYAQSKMAVVLYTRSLAKAFKASGVTAISMTPGMVRTGLGRDTKGGLKIFLSIMSLFIRSPEAAAADVIHLAKMAESELTSGGFYKRTELTEPKGTDTATPEKVAELIKGLIRTPNP
jgi:NAD(P)-dependent dehydrogenase (short-subunit alcohol dehydrogenase family)